MTDPHPKLATSRPRRKATGLFLGLLTAALTTTLAAPVALGQHPRSDAGRPQTSRPETTRPETTRPDATPDATARDAIPGLRRFDSQYYIVRTDVDDELAKEAVVRMDRMFEEYAWRARDFATPPRQRLPFYLFTKADDYVAAGGVRGSAGIFSVQGSDARLMGTVIPNGGTWHVVQHEGFHQFAYFAISKDLPLWVNEGLAEYFGEARFTGDGMVSGLIPEGRRRRVVEMIRRGKYHPFPVMLGISGEQWARELSIENYDQAWSMVHFMAEGDGGKYQAALLSYMKALARGAPEQQAWTAAVGEGAAPAFEAAWKKYWLGLPTNPTLTLYSQSRMMTLASFLARSRAAGQSWSSVREFVMAARENRVRIPSDPTAWLPASLLADAVTPVRANQAGVIPSDDTPIRLEWNPAGLPKLSAQYPDGTSVTVTFSNEGGKPRTTATVSGPAASGSLSAPPRR